MKKLTYIIMALALVLGLAQCKKEQPQPQGKKVYITLKVGSDAKHTVNPANGKVYYTTGDKIYVGNHGKYIGTLTYDGSAFGGDITDPQTTDYLHFYFVGGLTPSAAPVAGTTTSFTVDISNQSSTLPVLSYVHTAEKYAGGTSYTCMLENKCALVELTLTSGTTAAVGIGDRYTQATINFGGTPGIAPNTETTGMITTKSESDTKKYAILLPQAAVAGSAIAIGHVGYTLDIPAMNANDYNKFSNEGAAASNIVYLNYLTENYTATNGQTLTGTLGANVKVSIADGAKVTLNNASINAAGTWTGNFAGITCLGDATIILSGTNTVKGFFDEYPGVYVPESYTLTIQGTGSLTASSNGFGAGIGGGYDLSCGNIEIQGGTITATGGDGCAGIGAGNAVYNVASCGNITISGGNITANGGESGAGIGTGFNGTCGNITISGGSITANGGSDAAGIGTGFNGNCGSITISGGSITANGGGSGAGIGTGYNGTCGNITISGGSITANGGGSGAGIGTGAGGTCGTITIYNNVTSVTATKGSSAPNSIGAGGDGSCGTVKFGDETMYNGSSWTTTPTDGGIYDGLRLAITTTTNTNDTWTLTPYVAPAAPTGAINGLFSVSSTKQVYFSQGNLQYTKSTGVWSFMEHQYSTVETNGSYCTNDYGNRDVVSLFGWATSGYNHGATCYQPYSTNPNNENYYAYGDASYNLYDQTGQADWGYNAISNGGNTVNSGWRTLTTEEWQYLFANHTKGWSTVNGVNGYVIRPDGVSTAIAASYTASDWATEEAAGSVFLPAAGYRNSYVGTDVYDKGSIGRYWSSSIDGSSNAYNLYFSSSLLGPNYSMNRKSGESVRLVKDAN